MAMGCESPQRLGGSDSQVIESSHVNTKSQRDGDELRSRAVGSAGIWVPNDSSHRIHFGLSLYYTEWSEQDTSPVMVGD